MFGERLWGHFQWPRFGPPAFSWRTAAALEGYGGQDRPERFRTVGRELFRDAGNPVGSLAIVVGGRSAPRTFN